MARNLHFKKRSVKSVIERFLNGDQAELVGVIIRLKSSTNKYFTFNDILIGYLNKRKHILFTAIMQLTNISETDDIPSKIYQELKNYFEKNQRELYLLKYTDASPHALIVQNQLAAPYQYLWERELWKEYLSKSSDCYTTR